MASNSFKVKNSLVLTPKDLSTLTSPEAGDLACDINDSNKIKRYDALSLSWVEVGSGSSGLETIFQLVGDDLSQWSSGNNATFLGAGSLSGTFQVTTLSPLNGIQSYKYTQGASSLNDYIVSPIKSIPIRFRGQTNTISFVFSYTGNTNDIVPVLYDVTNSSIIIGSTNTDGYALSGTNGGVRLYQANFTIPLTCTQIRFGFQVKVLNSGKVLDFDDVQIKSDSVINVPQAEVQSTEIISASSVGTLAKVTTALTAQNNSGIFRYLNGDYTILKPCTFTIAASFSTAGSYIQISRDGVSLAVDRAPTSDGATASITVNATVGQVFSVTNATSVATTGAHRVFVSATATSSQILTAPESFSTDTAQLTYASSSLYNLTTLANAPVGTYITFTYAANTNTRTQTTVRPTQTDADMNVNGIQVFTRAYNATSSAASPACIAIQIGKGLKGVSKNLYKSAGKVIAGALDQKPGSSTYSIFYGMAFKDYNENTGILVLDAGNQPNTNVTSALFQFTDNTEAASGYLVINASKSPALTGVPQLLPRIATLSDVKASGTAGGTATSGSYQTRTLNTLSDPTGIVTSLASNQFTLPAGEYYIEASAPTFGASGDTKVKIRNITDSTDSVIGASSYGAASSTVRHIVIGNIVISSAKTFELQHRVAATLASNGFGTNNSFGDSEVYSIVKITKVK